MGQTLIKLGGKSSPDRSAGFDMRGVGGITLSDFWAGGRRSLHGMLVHNCPNMAVISGLTPAA